ncbi:MAG: hypothetical protein ACRELV_07225 [Longimicrobiales bacterium]
MAVLLLIGAAAQALGQGIDRELARAYFAEAETLGEAGSELWGAPLYGPLLFVDRGTREVVANIADPRGALAPADGVHVGTWPDSLAIYNGAVAFAGRTWTMLAWPLPEGRYERRRLLGHELFHRLQVELGIPAPNPGNAHLDGEAGRAWLRLEWRALQDALARAGDARREAVRDALLFRARRHELFPAGASDERALELNEGLAEYTGVRVAIPGNARPGWVVRQLDDHDARAARTSIVRSFAYASGPAYGVLLDGASGTWRHTIFEVGDLGRALAQAYRIQAMGAGSGDLPRRRALLYGGERLFAEEAEREARRAAQQARFRERFVTGPTLILPASEDVSYSFDPNAVAPFDEGGTVYLTTTVRDEWGTLTVTAGGALIVSEAGRVARIVVPAPADEASRPLRGEGWELVLAEGWEVRPLGEGDVTVLLVR